MPCLAWRALVSANQILSELASIKSQLFPRLLSAVYGRNINAHSVISKSFLFSITQELVKYCSSLTNGKAGMPLKLLLLLSVVVYNIIIHFHSDEIQTLVCLKCVNTDLI